MLVEDDAADHDLIKRAFAKNGTAVTLTVVEDGEQALAYLRQAPISAAPAVSQVLVGPDRWQEISTAAPPDLIMMDYNLPRAEASEVIAEIRRDENICLIPIIVFSTTQSPRDLVRAYQAGANGFLVKPADLGEFFAALHALEQFWLRYAALPGDTQG